MSEIQVGNMNAEHIGRRVQFRATGTDAVGVLTYVGHRRGIGKMIPQKVSIEIEFPGGKVTADLNPLDRVELLESGS